MTNPWNRRPDESDKAWIAFVAYRDAGPADRSVRKTAAALGKSETLVGRWSSTHDWPARASAWDAWVDERKTQPAVAKARAEMAERHLRLGKALQGRAAQGLGAIKPEKLKPSEVAALAKAGVDIERVAAGEPTEIQQHTFANEARDRLRRLFGDDPSPQVP